MSLGQLRRLASPVLHSHPIPLQWLSLQDTDKVYRNLRYYDSEMTSNSSLATDPSSSPASPSSTRPPTIPTVLLCGTAQSIPTWSSHLRYFSNISRFIIPELRCQGSTELLSSAGSITQHVEDLYQFLQQKELHQINLIGFSLGGRVSLAFAARYPDYVHKLSLTGVPLTRPPLGHLILQSWKEGLDQEDYRATAWSCILNGFSPSFLAKNSKSIPGLVDDLMRNNDMGRLRDLLTHALTPHSVQYIESYVKQLSCPIQVICGQHDRIAGSGSERALAELLPFGSYEEVPDCGHLVPFEKPGVWRTSIATFLHQK
jgi:2-succinyl-6-hydroxy-2,4-cyclohexadiene-1-carboxylate synthase